MNPAKQTKSFAALYAVTVPTHNYQAVQLAVSFMADVHAAMLQQKLTESEVAARAGLKTGYLTRLFRGNSQLSLPVMVSLAAAVGCKPALTLAA
jgi:AraC-like DNA-binding protein